MWENRVRLCIQYKRTHEYELPMFSLDALYHIIYKVVKCRSLATEDFKLVDQMKLENIILEEHYYQL